MGGCDKTTPGLLMGASSMNLPSIFLPAGPMLRGHWGGTTLGSGSDVWKYWADLRAGELTEQAWQETQEGLLERLGPEAPGVLGSWLGALDHDGDPSRNRSEPSITPPGAPHCGLTGAT